MINTEYLENYLSQYETESDDFNFFAISYYGKKYKSIVLGNEAEQRQQRKLTGWIYFTFKTL